MTHELVAKRPSRWLRRTLAWAVVAGGLLAPVPVSVARDVQPADRAPRVVCNNGMLSVEAAGVSAMGLLEEVGERCRVAVSFIGLEDRLVSIQLEPTPIGGALLSLLTQAGIGNHAEVYGPIAEGEPHRPERLILLGWGDGTAQGAPAVLVAGGAAETPKDSGIHVARKLLIVGELPTGSPVATEALGQPAKGLKLKSVAKESVLDVVGVRPGDILLEVNGLATDSQKALDEALQYLEQAPDQGLRFALVRSGKYETRYVVLH